MMTEFIEPKLASKKFLMTNKTIINGEYSDDQMMEIIGNEASSKILVLSQKINGLEQENEKIIFENKKYDEKI